MVGTRIGGVPVPVSEMSGFLHYIHTRYGHVTNAGVHGTRQAYPASVISNESTVVVLERLILCYDEQIALKCLGDQHSVEWIPMVKG